MGVSLLSPNSSHFVHRKILSDHSWNDHRLCEPFRRGRGRAPRLGQIIPVSTPRTLDHPQVSQSPQPPRQLRWREHGQGRSQIGPALTGDHALRVAQCPRQRAVSGFEEIDPLDGFPFHRTRLCHPALRTNPGGVVIQPCPCEGGGRPDEPDSAGCRPAGISRRSIRL